MGAAGNSGWDLNAIYAGAGSPTTITVFSLGSQTLNLQWKIGDTLNVIIDAINSSARSRPRRSSTDRTDRWSWGNLILRVSLTGISGTAPTRWSNLPLVAAVQAYRDIVAPDLPAPQAHSATSISLGAHRSGCGVTIATSFFSTDTTGTLGNAIRLDFGYSVNIIGTGVSGSVSPDEITVNWLATDTLQDIIDRTAGSTQATLSLIPGSSGSTVMGHGRSASAVFGGQTVLQDGTDNYILFTMDRR